MEEITLLTERWANRPFSGGKGIRVNNAGELKSALEFALNDSGPALVEILTDADLI